MKRSLALSGAIHALLLLALLCGGVPRFEVSAPAVIQVLLLDGVAGAGRSGHPSPAAARASSSPAAAPSARRIAGGRPAARRTVAAGPGATARRAAISPAKEALRPVATRIGAGEPPGTAPGEGSSAGDGGSPVPEGIAGAGASGAGGLSGGERDHRIAIIRRRIQEALVYPREARRRGIEGTSHVRFDLTDAGRLRSLVLERSSGKRLLDDASLRTVERAQPFPFVDGALIVPVVFRLSGVQ